MREYFNNWRKNYNSFSYEDQKKIYNFLEEKYPIQKSFSKIHVKKFLSNSPSKILEVGGWKGDLAHEILKENKTIKVWHNYEICSNAKDKTVCKDKRYKCIVTNDFIWNLDCFKNYDTCIMSHIIEHITEKDLRKLFSKLTNIKYFYLEAPIRENGQSFSNTMGTHILKCGWNTIKKILKEYKEKIINRNVRIYEKQ